MADKALLEQRLFDAKARYTTLYKQTSTPMTAADQALLAPALDAVTRAQRDLEQHQDRDSSSLAAHFERLAASALPPGAPIIPSSYAGPRRSSLPPGQEFIGTDLYKEIVKSRHSRPDKWQSQSVELMATVLTEAPASGGALVVPQYLPGITASPLAPPVMSQLFASGQADSNSVVFMEETTYTNAAAPVAEGTAKPESAFTFTTKTNKVEKIAHWLPVTDELLEDAPAIGAYLDNRLRLGVLLALDNQLLNGTGVSPELLGLLIRTDLTAALPMGTATALDAIAAQIAAVEAASQLPVDAVVMNGGDWVKAGLSKTSTGEYLGSNPFDAPQAPTLWGRKVALTPKMPQGTALVGAFASGGGMLFQRGGIHVSASNSHQDYFILNKTAIRAEIRVALALFRPSAFGKVTGLFPVTP